MTDNADDRDRRAERAGHLAGRPEARITWWPHRGFVTLTAATIAGIRLVATAIGGSQGQTATDESRMDRANAVKNIIWQDGDRMWYHVR